MDPNLAAPGPSSGGGTERSDVRRRRRVRAYVGLGSNLGDRERALVGGIAALGALPGAEIVAVSDLYATAPVGVTDQPEFRNAVVGLDVAPGPDPVTGAVALLVALKRIERAFGRRRRRRWGPRELDLDLLLFGAARLSVERPPEGVSAAVASDLGRRPDERVLIVPHPEVAERLFVLAPLADVAPALVPPGWTVDVATAKAERERVEGEDAVRHVGRWDAEAREWRPV
ncbi:MAG TPA: 2-amino-4-hydroxy-6-hydroxymethyldihydropteridine diphosphokinase [Candidatus Limnocylindrales bacterium]|nr:2-amino-4-hydroxy-6-hydroxymethyldihydropteridine diphosphokinase [Candidatus Limnocylindrales bacterium]